MLADSLRQLRKSKNMTQSALASVLGVSTATVAMWETARREPDTSTLITLAAYFGVSVDYLLGSEKTPPETDKELEGVEFALWGEVKQLTPAQKQDILDYIRYKKQRTAGENTEEQ